MWHFIDVAGQLDKRPKWIPYFENAANAILFVASASCYDQFMEEDTSVNQFIDGLVLFDNIVNHPALKNASIILFLNKIDLLNQKLIKSRLSDFIPYYKGIEALISGKNEKKDVMEFMSKEFLRKNSNTSRTVILHYTQGTDVKMMSKIIESVKLSIFKTNYIGF